MTDEQLGVLDKVGDKLADKPYEGGDIDGCEYVAFVDGFHAAMKHLEPLIDECNYLCDDRRIKEALKKVFGI